MKVATSFIVGFAFLATAATYPQQLSPLPQENTLVKNGQNEVHKADQYSTRNNFAEFLMSSDTVLSSTSIDPKEFCLHPPDPPTACLDAGKSPIFITCINNEAQSFACNSPGVCYMRRGQPRPWDPHPKVGPLCVNLPPTSISTTHTP
ncbi:hypothetical protein K7432_014174, partial [Basidiobolus ranarum]